MKADRTGGQMRNSGSILTVRCFMLLEETYDLEDRAFKMHPNWLFYLLSPKKDHKQTDSGNVYVLEYDDR